MSVAPRAVVVHRPTEYDELVARHGTRQQVAFFLGQRQLDLAELDARHEAQASALAAVAAAIPADWRRARVVRSDLDRWLFEPGDVVIAVGQDGLVANVAKYLDGQAVVGVNPEPGRNAGVLVTTLPHQIGTVVAGLAETGGSVRVESRAMVEIVTDDGRSLRALNEVFIGHPSHQSARYTIAVPGAGSEPQSSSGILVGTGTGSTGWCRSVWSERAPQWKLPESTSTTLAWFVREAWPSPATGTALTGGLLTPGQGIEIVARSDTLVAFGDGIEADKLELPWGQRATVRLAAPRLLLAST